MKKEMKLHKETIPHAYACEVTRFLDKINGIKTDALLKHYVYINPYGEKRDYYELRIAGGTVGTVWYDEDFVIKKIDVDRCNKHLYLPHVNEIMCQFIGKRMRIA